MKRKLVCCLAAVIYFSGCGYQGQGYKQLEEIDSLLSHEMVDSAWNLIEHFNPWQLDEKTVAYYHLLYAQSRYKAYRPFTSDSIINLALDYYESNGDQEKLARCYFYKGGILLDLGKKKDALISLKEAEKLLEPSGNDILQHNVYLFLSSINAIYKEDSLALKYAKRALDCSMRTKKQVHLAYDYEKLLVIYNTLGEKDSSLYYTNHAMKVIDNIPSNPPILRARLWGNLGVAYSSIDPERAETFLEKAISLMPQDTFETIALFVSTVANFSPPSPLSEIVFVTMQ